jgi:hypothetical protein
MSDAPIGSTVSGLSHAARLVWEVIKETREYAAQYKDIRMRATWMKALDAVNVLTRNGADNPIGFDAPTAQVLAPWEIDTPEARRLLALLTEAQAVAELVDSQRGNVLSESIPTSSMESRGTDYAESISNLAIRLHMEVVPPQGRD